MHFDGELILALTFKLPKINQSFYLGCYLIEGNLWLASILSSKLVFLVQKLPAGYAPYEFMEIVPAT